MRIKKILFPFLKGVADYNSGKGFWPHDIMERNEQIGAWESGTAPQNDFGSLFGTNST